MRSTSKLLAAGTVVLFASVSPGPALAQSTGATATAVEVVHPAVGEISRWVTLPGSIRALQEATLYAKVAGYLKTITVDKGDTVKANATVAVLETPELDADVIRYRAEVSAAKSEYDRLHLAVEQAPDLIVPAELDRAKGRYDVANANLQRTQSLLNFGRVTAPFSGVVTRRFVDQGAFIPAASGGAPQSAAIVTLMNFATVRVQVAVPEAEAPLVKKGQPVRFSVEGLPDRKFESVVARYSYALDETTKTMVVEAQVPNASLELRPGMYASVMLALEHRKDVLLIPAAALVMEKTNAFAYVAAAGAAHKRAIKLGFNDGAKAQVLDGLTAQDEVILVGKKTVVDGQKITVAAAK
jgi:membrane fusion protein (multidrug efflux system)